MQRKKILIAALTTSFVLAAGLLYAGKNTTPCKQAFPCCEREVVKVVVEEEVPSKETLNVSLLPTVLYL
jgi:hypothetical protein